MPELLNYQVRRQRDWFAKAAPWLAIAFMFFVWMNKLEDVMVSLIAGLSDSVCRMCGHLQIYPVVDLPSHNLYGRIWRSSLLNA